MLEEEEDEMVTQICEIFEEIHILIFVIMVCFIALVTILLLSAQHTHKHFQLNEIRQDDNWNLETMSFLKKWAYLDTLRYRLIRHEFYHPCDGKEIRGVKPATFDFSEYLGRCMVEFVVELIEIPPSSFVVLFFVLLA